MIIKAYASAALLEVFKISNKVVAVIGGGPAGMMAAIAASSSSNKVILFDKMEKLGTKLLITGKGRCNLTHQIGRLEEIFEGYPKGAQFLHSSFNKFPPAELIKFFESRGVKCKPDRGRRIFPASEKSSDICGVLLDELKRGGVSVRLNTPIIEIMAKSGSIASVRTAQKEIIDCSKVIVATGGMTYPWTGSTGDGYIFAKKTGHGIVTPRPSLVPLEVAETHISFALEGLSLKNVKAFLKADGKVIDQRFGEMVFTSYGLSGPVILYLSRKTVNCLAENLKTYIVIDLKPALAKEKIASKLDADLEKNRKKLLKNLLDDYLPQKMTPVFMQEMGLTSAKQCAQLTSKEKNKIAEGLKGFTLTVLRPRGMSEAEVTQGGVDLKDIDPRTMESKIIKGLYFAGETLDIDGYIGGFNLQAAFSTGFSAGKSAGKI